MEQITCQICERVFNRPSNYRQPNCMPCATLATSGMSPEEICLAKAERTRSVKEHDRLQLVAQKHRLNQEEFAKQNSIDQRRNNELRALREGLQPRRKDIYSLTQNRTISKKAYRCSRCGDLLSIKRCLACELEIARG